MATEVNRWPLKAVDGQRGEKMATEGNRWPEKEIDGHRRQ
jgi:hypothetical protein